MDDGTLGNSASRKIMFDEVKRQAKLEAYENLLNQIKVSNMLDFHRAGIIAYINLKIKELSEVKE